MLSAVPALEERQASSSDCRVHGRGEGVQDRVVTTELDTLLVALYVHGDDHLIPPRWRADHPG